MQYTSINITGKLYLNAMQSNFAQYRHVRKGRRLLHSLFNNTFSSDKIRLGLYLQPTREFASCGKDDLQIWERGLSHQSVFLNSIKGFFFSFQAFCIAVTGHTLRMSAIFWPFFDPLPPLNAK